MPEASGIDKARHPPLVKPHGQAHDPGRPSEHESPPTFLMQEATALHRGGQLSEAVARYEQVLAQKNLDAMLLAPIHCQQGSDPMNAHLAGALGRPTFVALRKIPDWRWLLGRDDSPWYPSARLFRQTTEGN